MASFSTSSGVATQERKARRAPKLEQSEKSKCRKQKKVFTQTVSEAKGTRGSGGGGCGKRSGQAKALKELKQGGYLKNSSAEPTNSLLRMPPSVTAAFKRNGDFLKRTFSLETLLRPLPAPLGIALERNLRFLGKTATQLFTGEGVQNAKVALGQSKK